MGKSCATSSGTSEEGRNHPGREQEPGADRVPCTLVGSRRRVTSRDVLCGRRCRQRASHLLAPPRRRREHAVVREQMHARARDQGGEPLDEGGLTTVLLLGALLHPAIQVGHDLLAMVELEQQQLERAAVVLDGELEPLEPPAVARPRSQCGNPRTSPGGRASIASRLQSWGWAVAPCSGTALTQIGWHVRPSLG